MTASLQTLHAVAPHHQVTFPRAHLGRLRWQDRRPLQTLPRKGGVYSVTTTSTRSQGTSPAPYLNWPAAVTMVPLERYRRTTFARKSET